MMTLAPKITELMFGDQEGQCLLSLLSFYLAL